MFTDEQCATLRAMIDRIIPADDFPSGWEAGVGDYLDRQLAGDLRHMLPIYQQGLQGLDAEAQQRYGAGFAALQASQQDTILAQIEQGQTEAFWSINPAQFFREACAHAAEGYYSDPGQGGNRDGISWQMLGFEVRG
jgi:hypothetical protein